MQAKTKSDPICPNCKSTDLWASKTVFKVGGSFATTEVLSCGACQRTWKESRYHEEHDFADQQAKFLSRIIEGFEGEEGSHD